mmetsp:Transcript_5434/g.9895  ORF Transcript_5434/g.9895 Transcript_5434/m.9895 type:complete len:228 (+) Transcript_5434:384-1067(+)
MFRLAPLRQGAACSSGRHGWILWPLPLVCQLLLLSSPVATLFFYRLVLHKLLALMNLMIFGITFTPGEEIGCGTVCILTRMLNKILLGLSKPSPMTRQFGSLMACTIGRKPQLSAELVGWFTVPLQEEVRQVPSTKFHRRRITIELSSWASVLSIFLPWHWKSSTTLPRNVVELFSLKGNVVKLNIKIHFGELQSSPQHLDPGQWNKIAPIVIVEGKRADISSKLQH